MKIYLTICNYNACDKLKETLDSILVSDPDKNLVSVNVIDNKSTDGSIEYLNSIGQDIITGHTFFSTENNKGFN